MVSQAITITVSHQNWCKVLQQKPIVIRDQLSDHRNSFTPELVQSFAEKPNGRMQSGMFCFALRQLPIKACNLLSCDGRDTLSISYKIESAVGVILLTFLFKEDKLFLLWVQRDPPK